MIDRHRRRWLLGLSTLVGASLVSVAWLRNRRTLWPLASVTQSGDDSAALTPATVSSTATPPERFPHPLRLPSRRGLLADVALTQPLSMTARITGFDVFAGKPTQLWHYAAQADGYDVANPLLHLRRGDWLDVNLANTLDEDTTVHWHGLLVDEANDGSGLHPVAPGAETRYRQRVRNRAGLYWYHAHPHGRTGKQVQHGMAGLLLIEDDEELALREHLGLRWGERDLPLLIADKQIDAENAIVYRDIGADDWIGNRVLVNWTPEPYLDVVPALYRLRIANVANARMWRLAFQYGDHLLPFHLIGTDGGLLQQAWSLEDLFLGPAQRADLLVDFSAVPAGARVLLRSLDYDAMENDDESASLMPDPMGDHPGAMKMGEAVDIMELRVKAGAVPDDRALIPAQLSSLPVLQQGSDWPIRKLRLRMDDTGTWFINDWNFFQNGHAPVFSVKRGSREIWEIRNSMSSMPHPIHVHGFHFRVLSRRISPADVRARQVAPDGLGAQDLGWSDTVVVWPGEVVRLALDFSQPCTGTQRYMLHCHNLEHEDMGMMVTFAVTD